MTEPPLGRDTMALAAAPVLLLAAGLAVTARVVDTCTQGAADSLMSGIVVAGLNLIGFAMLVRGTKPWLLALIVALPTLAALSYTGFAAHFWIGFATRGMTACEAKTGAPFDILDGSEREMIIFWVLAAAIYWLGLANAAWRSFFTKRNRGLESTH